MCGICGKLNFEVGRSVGPELVRSMLSTIAHRGPDGEGIHVSGPVGLGHRRLSIIDLSTGQQPLCNEDGTVWITFNGEIYNYQELREDLLARGHVFKTRSDTEVIVHLYEEYGPACLEKLRGMFAFAIWDSGKKSLFLARDRVGIKPVYYRLTRQSLIFASEVKAILADPEVEPEIQPEFIDRFLAFLYMPGEETLFRDIRKLQPGHYLLVENGHVTIKQYWDLRFAPTKLSFHEAEERLMDILEKSVRLHMIADVPVGFLLSGGVDSTAVLSLATGKTEYPLSSYTLGFAAPGITDERPYAQLAADTYRTEHHELTISYRDFESFLPDYIRHMEEPVCEPPAIALYYVSKLAKDYVKVLMSGEGGDEAFAGYQTYRTFLWMERLKSCLGPAAGAVSGGLLALNRILGVGKVARLAPLLNIPLQSYYYSRTSGPASFFNSKRAEFYSPEFARSINHGQSVQIAKDHLAHAADYGMLNKMLYVDTKTWLTDDLLLKADKMTMANSIELRVPLLDHQLLEFAASLPENFKVRNLTTKYIAKKVLGRRVPEKILNRRKTGFPVPYASWLRNEMRAWVSDILLDSKSLSRGYFKRAAVEQLLSENERSGRYPKEVFSLLILELWNREFIQKREPVAPNVGAAEVSR